MKTKEQIEIKKYKTFPSMEWGENGGCCCDIYVKGKKVATYFDEGNGGEANVDMTDNMTYCQLKNLCYEANERMGLNEGIYPQNIHYECAIDTLVAHLADMKDIQKIYNKEVKKGYNYVMIGRTWNKITWCGCVIDRQKEMKEVVDKNLPNISKYYFIDNPNYFNNL